MAYEVPVLNVPGLVADGDLSAKQYYFVKISGAGTVAVCSAVTDRAIGVLQNEPASGQAATVMAVGVSKISSDEALSRGDLVGPSADGQCGIKVPGTDITEYIHGQVVVATGAAGEIATVLLNCANVARAA